MLTAGFSKVCISPPIGAPLAGFAAREGVCEGIHDDLFARAVVLANDEEAVALVSVDVLALSSGFVDQVRKEIEQRTGVRRDSRGRATAPPDHRRGSRTAVIAPPRR